MSDTPNPNPDLDRLKKACEQLSEFYDSVQIFATRHESGTLDGTGSVVWGSGNWFARHGVVQEWLVKQDESARIHARKREKEDEE